MLDAMVDWWLTPSAIFWNPVALRVRRITPTLGGMAPANLTSRRLLLQFRTSVLSLSMRIRLLPTLSNMGHLQVSTITISRNDAFAGLTVICKYMNILCNCWWMTSHFPAVGINAAYMQTYIGGVSCPYICGRHLDHGVLLVGYGASGFAPIRLKDKAYWIIKNSWGENWGEHGYYKICRGSNVRNKCGVDSMVSTVSAIHTSKE